MKTKLIILAAAAAAILYSCSNDRDDEVRQEAIEKVKNSNQNFKLNKSGIESRDAEPQAISDTIIVKSGNTTMADDPDTNLDPIDGGDPTTITPPKR